MTWMTMRLGPLAWLGALAALMLAATASAQTPAGLRLERVVMIMRHGVRPPTKAQPMAVGVAKDPWPSWDVPPGYLTAHGAKAVALAGAYQRDALSRRGLFDAKTCPAAGTVSLAADSDERTIKTAEAFAASFAPGCGLSVAHRPQDEPDPVYHPFDAGVGHPLDAAVGARAVQARLGSGGLAAKTAAHRDLLARLQAVYGCCAPPICDRYGAKTPCSFSDLPTTLAEGGEKPAMQGALDLASTAAQILVLEYAEGKPMSDVGWGRASKADIVALAAFHPLEYDIVARPPAVARAGAAPFLAAIEQAFARDGAKLTLMVAHDTNIAHIGGALDLHWKAGDFPADDPSPGGALVFEQLRDAAGARYVQVRYVAQTLDQLRELRPLDAAHPPAEQTLKLPGCATLCPAAQFKAILAAARPAG